MTPTFSTIESSISWGQILILLYCSLLIWNQSINQSKHVENYFFVFQIAVVVVVVGGGGGGGGSSPITNIPSQRNLVYE